MKEGAFWLGSNCVDCSLLFVFWAHPRAPQVLISLRRTTLETDIVASMIGWGTGHWYGNTGVGFFDHLLSQLATHSLTDIRLFCCGDLWTGWHHTVEDTGIVVGMLMSYIHNVFHKNRFSSVSIPMDSSLVTLSVDLSGRSGLCWNSSSCLNSVCELRMSRVFFDAFSRSCNATVHVNIVRVDDYHHVAEALFKALGICYKAILGTNNAVKMSTKGKVLMRWR